METVVFSCIGFAPFEGKSERDYRVYPDWRDPTVRRVTKVWSDTIIRFAKTGQPNGGELTNWPKYNDCERYCLVLNEDFQVQSDRDKLHRNVWQSGAVM